MGAALDMLLIDLGEARRLRNVDNWTDTADRLVALLEELLKGARPPWWRIDLRIMRASDLDYILACAHYGWPDWYRLAIRQGVDKELLTGSAKLVGASIPGPRKRQKPYLGG